MSHKLLTFIVAGLCLMAGLPALAQDKGSTEIFHLLRNEDLAKKAQAEKEVAAKAWEPHLQPGKIQFGLSLGRLDLNQSVFNQEQIIYKFNDEATYWGDVDINGGTAFNPVFHLGYSLNRWLTVETLGGLSFSEYKTTITNRHRRENDTGSTVDFDEPPLGEYDAEARSLLAVQFGVNAVVYPLAIKGEGRGRFHPYVTAGIGRTWYDMNSNYNNGSTGSNDMNFGGGIRILADRTISIRLEAVLHTNTLQWEPDDNFLVLNDGSQPVPLEEFPINPETRSFTEQMVTSYNSVDMSTLNMSLGFQGSF